jgi:hypothetical protein
MFNTFNYIHVYFYNILFNINYSRNNYIFKNQRNRLSTKENSMDLKKCKVISNPIDAQFNFT